MALSKRLDDFIFTSVKNNRANLFLNNNNGEIMFTVNTNSYSLDDIKSNPKVKESFINDLKTQRQNINVTNINSTTYQAQLKARNTLITNVTQYEGEYFVQPYIEYSHEANTEIKPQSEVITEQLISDANQVNTDVEIITKNDILAKIEAATRLGTIDQLVGGVNNIISEKIGKTYRQVYNEELAALDENKTYKQSLIERVLQANNIDPNELNDDEALSRTKDTTKLDSKAFTAWLSKNLPQLSVGDKSNLEQLKLNLTDTFGMFKGMTIYLFDGAGSKTAFHEAFHGVFRNFLSLDEKHAIIKEAKTKYSVPTEDELKSLQEGLSRTYTNEQLTYLYYEEKLADEFAEFTYNYNNKSFLQKLGRSISDFFNKILSLFNLFTLNNSAVETVFTNINKAKYSKSKSSKVEGVSIVNRPLEVFKDEVAYSKALRDKFNTINIFFNFITFHNWN